MNEQMSANEQKAINTVLTNFAVENANMRIQLAVFEAENNDLKEQLEKLSNQKSEGEVN